MSDYYKPRFTPIGTPYKVGSIARVGYAKMWGFILAGNKWVAFDTGRTGLIGTEVTNASDMIPDAEVPDDIWAALAKWRLMQ